MQLCGTKLYGLKTTYRSTRSLYGWHCEVGWKHCRRRTTREWFKAKDAFFVGERRKPKTTYYVPVLLQDKHGATYFTKQVNVRMQRREFTIKLSGSWKRVKETGLYRLCRSYCSMLLYITFGRPRMLLFSKEVQLRCRSLPAMFGWRRGWNCLVFSGRWNDHQNVTEFSRYGGFHRLQNCDDRRVRMGAPSIRFLSNKYRWYPDWRAWQMEINT